MSTQGLEPIVYGYHGTSSEASDLILREGFLVSRNPYDWLGDGVYFFQDALHRAWEWASERHGNAGAVIGAEISLVDCMDLLDLGWSPVISDAYDSYLRNLRNSGQGVPVQSRRAHRMDREVINYTVGVLGENGIRIACVRAAFAEGRPVYPDSAIYDRTHIQIAVRDIESCIRRTWREEVPRPGR
jgi:hypothetical protein